MTSLYCRRLHLLLNGTGPTYYIGSLFKYRHTPYGLSDEGLNLELPNFNLKFKKNSFTYSKLWNSLPSQVRLPSDANFKTARLQLFRKCLVVHDCSFLLFLERVL